MNTITSKELRANLGDILHRVKAGEHIEVTYRNKPIVRLAPPKADKLERNRLAGLDAFLAAPKKPTPTRYTTGDIKELYREDMAKKYGIK